MTSEDSPEDEPVDQIRHADEVARRCIVLYAVLGAGHGVPRSELVAWLRREGLWDSVTPNELGYLLTESPTERQRIHATWRAESLSPLLWALGLLNELPSPMAECNVGSLQDVLPPTFGPVAEFISSARLRSDEEILNANKEIYHIHWRVRDAQLRGEPTPPGKLPRMPTAPKDPTPEAYDAGVVFERHHALNWLIGYRGQDWDHITTDT